MLPGLHSTCVGTVNHMFHYYSLSILQQLVHLSAEDSNLIGLQYTFAANTSTAWSSGEFPVMGCVFLPLYTPYIQLHPRQCRTISPVVGVQKLDNGHGVVLVCKQVELCWNLLL